MPSTIEDRFGQGQSTAAALKLPCKVVITDASYTLSGEVTYGGTPLVENDRVLRAPSSAHVDSGIWIVSSGAWSRSKDWDGARDVVKGTMVLVAPNTAAEQFWIVQTDNPIYPGTTAVLLEQHTPEELALRTDLADAASVLKGANIPAYNPALAYTLGLGAFLNYTFARSVQEVANSVTPTNYAFAPGDIRRYLPAAELAAIYAYTSTYDCATGLQSAVTSRHKVTLPSGLFRIGSSVTITYQGCHIQGAGYGSAGTRLKRLTDTSFGPLILSAGGVGGEHTIIEDLKMEDYSGLSDTNTSPLLTIGCNDWTLRSVWLLNGYQGLYCPQASSNGHIEGNIFEACRKQGIYGYSAVLLKIIGNTFWKCTADSSNPSDRSATIMLHKNPVYSFGSGDINIVGNYFFETVYGHHIELDEAEGVQIVGNFFTVASQVDYNQRDDIYMLDSTRISIAGNTSNSLLNSYAPSNPQRRGSRYCVNIDTGCSSIEIGTNGFLAGATGTINDPNHSAVIFGSNTGVKLANVTSTNKRVNNYHRWYVTSDLSLAMAFGGAAAASWTYTIEGRFQRDGNHVKGVVQIQITAKGGTETGAFTITGLPYTAVNVAGLQMVGGVRLSGINVTPNGGRVLPNTATATVDKITAGVSAQLTDADFPAGAATVTVEISYFV